VLRDEPDGGSDGDGDLVVIGRAPAAQRQAHDAEAASGCGLNREVAGLGAAALAAVPNRAVGGVVEIDGGRIGSCTGQLLGS
jgi:hypothetical protein